MKILIVNGYSKTPKGKEAFTKYQELVQEIFKNQKDFIDTNYEFIIRHRDELDEFLYELDSPFVRKSAAKTFDHLDMIFVEGDATLLPWSPAAQKMLILLRMCLRTKKILYASAFGMLALVFLAATNVEKTVNIINGGGKGGKVSDIINLDYNPMELKPQDYFLDNVTGDLYSYSYETNEWIPKFNVGLHYVRAAQAFDTVGKYIIKTPVYKPKPLNQNNPSYLSKHTEDFCMLKKIYLQHWALQGLEFEFVIPAKNTWDIHQFNFINPNKTFVVLAESKTSPQIIYFDHFCLASLFNISKKYPQTCVVLKNFIIAKLKEIKSMDKDHNITIEKASEMARTTANYFGGGSKPGDDPNRVDGPRRITLLGDVRKNKGSDDRPKTSQFFHSGFAFSHHDGPQLIVENNTVRNAMNVKIDNKKLRQNTSAGMRSPKGQLVSPKDYQSDDEDFGFKNSRPWTGANDIIEMHNQLQRYNDSVNPNRQGSFAQFMDDNPGQTKGILKGKSNDNNFKKTKSELFTMLYPELPRDVVDEEEFWVPGQLSQTKMNRNNTTKDIKRITMESSYSKKFYNTFNKFKDLDLDEARAKPSIRRAGEYMTEEERKRRDDKEASRYNIGPNRFKYATKGEKAQYVTNYVISDFSQPATSHKFREIKKDKWVAGELKLC